MKKVTLVARYLLALMLVVFGLNKFIGFIEYPPLEGFASEYMAVIASSYILKSMGVVYLISALMLATNKAVGLATVFVAPIAFNALMFHLTLDPANIAGAIMLTALTVLVMAGNAEKYKGLLS